MLPRTRLLARPLLSSHWTPSPSTAPQFVRPSPIAPSSSSSSLLLVRHASSSSSSNKKSPQKSTILRDEDIPHPLITLVDPSTSSLLPPASLQDILVQLDRTRFSIVLVDAKAEVPVCRIVDKKAEFERSKAKKSSAKASASADADAPQLKAKAPSGPPKEVHLTWGVTPHDLGHKLSKARDFLAKGSRVVVVLKDKKGVEKVGKGQQQSVVGNVVEALQGSGKLVREQGKGGEWRVEFAPSEQ
ncbi:hypothetical protein BCR35DRAFT_301980 [Leucosporidium creatinivorum]|uniref:Translation initiation factor 3 N-terminal domain-containing protein n=1 Tax=Leucosporidium creatinivorum TaxID=106004 RepID=A0A1Y2FVS3_9BASI|nr:hypothetical protein BCR35DRAFT_301980 [Leucosporidium creatinivorum]